MNKLHPLAARLWQSPVVWSWAFSGLRLTSGILLLPLLIGLSGADFECYWALFSLAALVPLLDLGLLTSIDRGIGYAMGGVTELQAHGLAAGERPGAGPNFPLLWKLMHTTRTIYRHLSIGVFFILGAWGTYSISLRAHETSNPAHTWLAWGLTLLGAVFEMYAGWWNVYLRGLNRVLLCARILTMAFTVKFVVSCTLLLAGGGLLSVPIASLISSFLQRELSRRHSMKFLSPHPSPPPSRAEVWALFRTLWPNGWRMGLHYLSAYLTVNTFICLKLVNTTANSQYALSVQIMNILQGMSLVWLQVKWPLIGQHMARQDFASLRKVFRTRLLLQLLTFTMLAIVVIPLAQPIVHWVKPDKYVLPLAWLALLAVNALLETHFVSWTTLINISNQLPFLRSTIFTNIGALLLALVLVRFTSLGYGAFVLAPLLAGSVVNYWRWAREGAHLLQTRWLPFMITRPG